MCCCEQFWPSVFGIQFCQWPTFPLAAFASLFLHQLILFCWGSSVAPPARTVMTFHRQKQQFGFVACALVQVFGTWLTHHSLPLSPFPAKTHFATFQAVKLSSQQFKLPVALVVNRIESISMKVLCCKECQGWVRSLAESMQVWDCCGFWPGEPLTNQTA